MKPPRLTLASGPGESPPQMARAIRRRMVHHTDPWFHRFYADLTEKLRRAAGVKDPPIIVQGEAVVALEAAAASLIAPGDKVINLVSGHYGRFFSTWIRRHTDRLVEVVAPDDHVVTAEQLAAALRAHPDARLVAAVHCETPSGTLTPLAELGRLTRGAGAIFLVDAVASFGGMALRPDAWGVDVAVLGAHKCLGGAPGVTPVTINERAWAKISTNPAAPSASILSLADWRGAHEPGRPFPFTPSVLDLYALDGALDAYLAEGATAFQTRHRQVAKTMRRAVRGLGLKLYPARDRIMADCVTVARMPAGLDERPMRAWIREHLGLQFAGGEGPLAGKVLRIGHMGPTARMATVGLAEHAIKAGLKALAAS